jgi:hypothetical protein
MSAAIVHRYRLIVELGILSRRSWPIAPLSRYPPSYPLRISRAKLSRGTPPKDEELESVGRRISLDIFGRRQAWHQGLPRLQVWT